MLQSYQDFLSQCHSCGFAQIRSQFVALHEESLAKWEEQPYLPKLQQFELEFDPHRSNPTWRQTPSFNGRRDYDNDDNLHRRVLSILRNFLLSDFSNLREYLRTAIDLKQLSTILSRMEVLRGRSGEWGLICWLFTASRKSMRLFLKLRGQLVAEGTHTPLQYHAISTHNPAKYAGKYIYLEQLTVPSTHYDELIALVGLTHDEDLTMAIFAERARISGVEIVQYCMWLNRQNSMANSRNK